MYTSPVLAEHYGVQRSSDTMAIKSHDPPDLALIPRSLLGDIVRYRGAWHGKGKGRASWSVCLSVHLCDTATAQYGHHRF